MTASRSREPTEGDTIIRADGLTKHFGSVEALSALDLEVSRGEVHGFLGPNGAGKSTTIRILLGLLRATSGRVELFGRDPWEDALAVHRRLAYVPGDVSLWPGLTGGQCIDILTYAQGGGSAPHREELIDRFELDPSKRSREYSKGNRQKVALIAALSTEVELLVLDEPTSGLDPLMEQVFQDVVRERRADGCTVLLSSHILGEVDEPSLPDGAPGLTGLETTRADGYVVTRCKVEPERLDETIGALHRAGIHTLTVTPPSLDELFLQNYRADATGPDGRGDDRDDAPRPASGVGDRQDVAP